MAKDAVSESGLPRTLIVSLTIGPACWLIPHQGAMSTLLPQRLNDIAPDEKVSLMVMFSSTAMVVALFSNIILGALSDRTRSRFGKRKPWIIGCSVLSCVALVMFGQASSVAAMLVWWCLYELVVNGVAAAMVGQLSDRVPERWRGTVSSAYGIGSMVGNQLGILIAAQFLGHVNVGINILAAGALCGGIVSALLAGEAGNVDEPRPGGGSGLDIRDVPVSHASCGEILYGACRAVRDDGVHEHGERLHAIYPAGLSGIGHHGVGASAVDQLVDRACRRLDLLCHCGAVV